MAKLCGVYLVTNTVNGKRYVGLSADIRKRWAEHRKPKAISKTVIHDAVRKYGAEAFAFAVLELCDQKMLEERERHWITALGTLAPAGYNRTNGGERLKTFSAETL